MPHFNLRHESDLRQLGGILFALAIGVLIFPLTDTVSLINGSAANDRIYYTMLIGDLCVVMLGLLCMGMAFALVACDYSSAALTTAAIVWEQTVFIDWIGKMVNLGNGTSSACYFYSVL